jgi:hypothetical protein
MLAWALASCVVLVCGCAGAGEQPKSEAVPTDGSRDFDFEFGSWHTHLRLLRHPLSGSNDWIECDGTTDVTKLLDGRANVVELRVSCPTGPIEGISLRLYEPTTHRWTLNFTNIRDGRLTSPVSGSFQDGRGTFYGKDSLGGRPILVRFVISPITPDSIRFEQSFSADDGRTWELNWAADDVRVKS